MFKSFGLILAVLLLLFLANPLKAYAADWNYSTPPPNDMSLYAKPANTGRPAPPKRRVHHHKHHHAKVLHTIKRAPSVHRVTHRSTGLFVYYALPATACCGEIRGIRKYRCCAHSGFWQTSNYATFKAGPEDLSYSATNDDDYRNDNGDWQLIADDSREDPE